MIYLEDIYKISVQNRASKYFKEKGYKSIDKYYYVKQKDLPPHSCVQERRKCDICGKDYFKRHEQHEVTFKRWNKDVCQECFKNNPFFKKEVKNRVKNTHIERYGGIGSASKIIREKVVKTCKERYGGIPMNNPTVKEKFLKTVQEKYGGNSPLCNEKVQEKARKTLYEKSLVPVSGPQKMILEILKELYPEAKCYLNYPLSTLSLDIGFELNSIKIDVEYDGKYWHNNEQKDRRRDEFTKSQGYKILRIKSRREYPKKEDIKEKIDYLLNTDHKYTELVLKDW